jgi:hypothetical protein
MLASSGAEAVGMGLVEGVDVGIARVDLGQVVLGVKALHLHLALLQQGVGVGRRDGLAGQRRARHAPST